MSRTKPAWETLSPVHKRTLWRKGDERVPEGWSPPPPRKKQLDALGKTTSRWAPLPQEVKDERQKLEAEKLIRHRRQHQQKMLLAKEMKLVRSYQRCAVAVVDLRQFPPNIQEHELWDLLVQQWTQVGISPKRVQFRMNDKVVGEMENPHPRTGRLPHSVCF